MNNDLPTINLYELLKKITQLYTALYHEIIKIEPRVAMVANWEGEGAIAPSCPYVAPPLVVLSFTLLVEKWVIMVIY